MSIVPNSTVPLICFSLTAEALSSCLTLQWALLCQSDYRFSSLVYSGSLNTWSVRLDLMMLPGQSGALWGANLWYFLKKKTKPEQTVNALEYNSREFSSLDQIPLNSWNILTEKNVFIYLKS